MAKMIHLIDGIVVNIFEAEPESEIIGFLEDKYNSKVLCLDNLGHEQPAIGSTYIENVGFSFPENSNIESTEQETINE